MIAVAWRRLSKAVLAGLLAVPLVCGAAPAAADGSSSPALVGPLLRTTLVVRDLDGAVRLFRDLLGLSVAIDLEIEGEEVNALLGTEGRRMRIVIFDVDGTPTGRIAVMAYHDPAPPLPAASAGPVDVGSVVLVLGTTDIDLAHARIREAGYPVVSEPRVVFQRPELAVQSREMMFIGPEGVVINLLQRGTPSAAAP
ncbi:MAG: hypothetical protein EHM68_15080 [Lysobacterales bacterium]|nr:MAG: hypothetical protein EHM68_15080 [Xanthomonadales bacterium]